MLRAGAADQVLERDPEGARAGLRSIRSIGQAAIEEMGTLLGLVRGEASEEAPRGPQPSLADLDRLIATSRESGLPVDLAIEAEAEAQALCMQTEDFARAYRAFVDKKPPVFEGD